MNGAGERMKAPIEIADEIVYGLDWNGLPDDEFHPKVDLNKLHNAIVKAVRDTYNRAARRAYRGGDPDRATADILRMRDGLRLDGHGTDPDGYEQRLNELITEMAE
jgi:hypothetical protein